MVKLKLGGVEYPLVLTVQAMDDLAQMGVTLENLSQYIFPSEGRPYAETVEHGLDVLHVLLEAGRMAEAYRTASDPGYAVPADILRQVLTPGQIWELCEAAVIESLKRTVEADHSKNGESAV